MHNLKMGNFHDEIDFHSGFAESPFECHGKKRSIVSGRK